MMTAAKIHHAALLAQLQLVAIREKAQIGYRESRTTTSALLGSIEF
jgi:hypothetical protein